MDIAALFKVILRARPIVSGIFHTFVIFCSHSVDGVRSALCKGPVSVLNQLDAPWIDAVSAGSDQ